MATFLVVIHVLVSLFLILIVLVQGGKGAEIGAAFGGGSSQTLFGSRGAATFLGKMTTVVAIVFMVTSMMLAIVSVKGGSLIRTTTTPAATSPVRAPVPGTGGVPAGNIPPESQVPLSNDKGAVTGSATGTATSPATGAENGAEKGTPAAPAKQTPAGK
jgi:preprotein translocase subunit SecG